MARLTYKAAQELSADDLLAILASGLNPDASAFALPVTAGIGDSKIAAGVLTAPAVAADIAVIAAGDLVAGAVYEVRISAGVSGSAVADLNNMRLLRGTTTVMSPVPQGATGNSDDIVIPRLTMPSGGAEALTIEAIAGGGAGIEYAAQIVATRIE